MVRSHCTPRAIAFGKRIRGDLPHRVEAYTRSRLKFGATGEAAEIAMPRASVHGSTLTATRLGTGQIMARGIPHSLEEASTACLCLAQLHGVGRVPRDLADRKDPRAHGNHRTSTAHRCTNAGHCSLQKLTLGSPSSSPCRHATIEPPRRPSAHVGAASPPTKLHHESREDFGEEPRPLPKPSPPRAEKKGERRWT
jgi:hypothetical protein